MGVKALGYHVSHGIPLQAPARGPLATLEIPTVAWNVLSWHIRHWGHVECLTKRVFSISNWKKQQAVLLFFLKPASLHGWVHWHSKFLPPFSKTDYLLFCLQRPVQYQGKKFLCIALHFILDNNIPFSTNSPQCFICLQQSDFVFNNNNKVLLNIK